MVIGAGNVGSTVAYTLMLERLASEIVIVDVNKDKAKAEVLDINHGIANFGQVKIYEGDYTDCKDCDIIIITAGIARKPGQTRLELAKINVGIARDIAKNIMKYATNPLIFVISNPVDVITYFMQREMGLPAGRIFGSGTTLDTARFRYLLGRNFDVDVRNVHAYILGEHGDSSVFIWSCANVQGIPLNDYIALNNLTIDHDAIVKETKESGAMVIANKGATYYGIAMSAARVTGSVIGDESSVFTVSSVLNGEYGLSDVALSLPAVVNRNGLDRIVNVKFSDLENEQLRHSAQQIREAIIGIEK